MPPAVTGHDAAAMPQERSAIPRPLCPDGSPEAILRNDRQAERATDPAEPAGTSSPSELRPIRQDNAAETSAQTGGES